MLVYMPNRDTRHGLLCIIFCLTRPATTHRIGNIHIIIMMVVVRHRFSKTLSPCHDTRAFYPIGYVFQVPKEHYRSLMGGQRSGLIGGCG